MAVAIVWLWLALLATHARPVLAADDVLRVGTSGDYPPFSHAPSQPEPGAVDLTDPAMIGAVPRFQASGFDIAVAERFARDTGRRVELVAFQWPKLMTELERGRFEVAMSGVTLRPDRALLARPTRPYLVTGAVAVVRAEEADRIHQLGWIDASNVRLGVNRGGHLERVARERFSRAQLVLVDDNTKLPHLLRDRQIDAAIAERVEADTWQRFGLQASPPFTRDRKVYLVAAKADKLFSQLDDWLAAHEADGWLPQLRRKWFGTAGQIDSAELCVEAVRARLETRLQIMPYVAAAKQRSGLAVAAPAQEARVLRSAREQAVAAQLDPDAVAALFRLLIEAAKAIQLETLMQSKPLAGVPPLASVRGAIAAESERLVRELARCRGELEEFATVRLDTGGLATGFEQRIRQAVQRIGRKR